MPKFNAELKEAMPHLWRYGFSLAGDRSAADDLVQDCVERALRRRSQWDQSKPLKPWLMTILLNIFRDRYRSRTRLAEVPFVTDHGGAAADTTVEDRDELAKVLLRMEALPEPQQQALKLVAFGGLTYADAAEVLNLPIGTILSRVARARAALNAEPAAAAQGLRSVK